MSAPETSAPIHVAENSHGGNLYAPRPGYPHATYWIAQAPNIGAPASAPPDVVLAYLQKIALAFNTHQPLVDALTMLLKNHRLVMMTRCGMTADEADAILVAVDARAALELAAVK